MKLTTETLGLTEALSTVTRAIGARSAKQIFEGVLVEAGEEGLSLTCSDGNLTIQNVLPAMVEETGRVVLPGRLFNDLTRKLEGTAIDLKSNENYRVDIRCARFKGALAGMNAAEYPEMPEVEAQATLEIPANRLREMIGKTVFCVGADERHQILTGVLVELVPEEMRMVALDGFRLALHRMQGSFRLPEGKEKVSFVVPGKVMNEMSRILPDSEEICKLTFGKTHMRMEIGSTRLITMLLAGEFIDYERILPKSFATEVLTEKKKVEKAIDTVSLLAREGKNNLVRMRFSEDHMTVDTNAEIGEGMDEADVVLTGAPIEIAFNAKYVMEALKNFTDEEMCMKFNANIHPCVIEPKDNKEYLYLILPVRMRN